MSKIIFRIIKILVDRHPQLREAFIEKYIIFSGWAMSNIVYPKIQKVGH